MYSPYADLLEIDLRETAQEPVGGDHVKQRKRTGAAW